MLCSHRGTPLRRGHRLLWPNAQRQGSAETEAVEDTKGKACFPWNRTQIVIGNDQHPGHRQRNRLDDKFMERHPRIRTGFCLPDVNQRSETSASLSSSAQRTDGGSNGSGQASLGGQLIRAGLVLGSLWGLSKVFSPPAAKVSESKPSPGRSRRRRTGRAAFTRRDSLSNS